MGLRLKVEHGQDAGRTWRLKDPGAYVVGRDATASIRVLDMKVSKGHCEIHVLNGNDGGARIRDLKSTHGTQLNGQPLARESELKPGDEIRLGFTVLRLLSDGPADAVAAPSGPVPKPEGAAATGAGNANAAAAPGPAASAPSPAASGAAAPAAAPGQKSLPPDELVGKTLGGYRVIRKIGQGGMGAVYMAEQVSLKREVALKVLSEKFVADSAFVDQFLNEARAAGQLNHPNVVQVYDVGQAEGRYFFSMEYVPGGAIEDRVKGGKSAEWPDALNWFLDAANALIFAQKRGILHRDVKPDNLMLAEDGSAKLCDLGLAKKSESQDLLAQGIIGTPHFLSPEAIRRKSDIDHRTDLYSLGCTFYRILAGENPYPAKTVKDILLAHLNKPVPRVTDKKPDVPKDLSDVVFRLMQKEPAQRYQSADDLYTALDKIRIQHGLAAHGIKPGGKKPLIIAAIVALLAAGAVAWVLLKPEPPRVKTPQELEREREQERERQRLLAEKQAGDRRNFLGEAERKVLELETEAAKKDVEKTWADEAFWSDFLKRLGALREQLESDPQYGKDEELKPILGRIQTLAEETTERRKFQAENATAIDTAKKTLVEDIAGALEGHLAKYRAAMAAEPGRIVRWWEAAALVDRGVVEGVMAPLRARAAKFSVKGKDVELVKRDVIDEQVKKSFPGTDWPGQDLYKEAFEAGKAAHRATMERLEALAADKKTESHEKAKVAFETYRDEIPAPDPSVGDTEITAELRAQRKDAKDAAERHKRTADLVRQETLKGDRVRFHRMVRFLREPERGKLELFDFGRPSDELLVQQGAMGDEAYRRRAQELLDDDKAFTALFENLVKTFNAKAWANLELLDEAGKAQKVTEAASDGLTCPAKTKRLWVDLGAKYLLEQVFYVKPGQPRFTFGAVDHRGLAVLAEMAGNRELAETHWKAYQATLTPEQTAEQLVASGRLAGLDVEVKVANDWRFIHETLAKIREFGRTNGLPLSPDNQPPLTPAQREAILREKVELLEKEWQNLNQVTRALHVDEKIAASLWGTSFRAQVHPRAAYTGETVPDSVVGPEPLVIPMPFDPDKPKDDPDNPKRPK